MNKMILESSLPKNWAITDLQTILMELQNGSRPRGGVQGIDQGIPSIGAEHLENNGGFNLKHIKFVPKKFYEEMTRGHIKFNDILIVKDGATTGKTSIINETFPFKKSVVNEHVFILRGIGNIVFQTYLFYYLFSSVGQKMIKSRITGSAQGGINQSFIKNFPIPLAPLNEQKRIVVKIDKLFPKIESNIIQLDKVTDSIVSLEDSVLHDAFSGKLTQKWRMKNKVIKFNNEKTIKIEETLSKKQKFIPVNYDNLPLIPKEWHWTRMYIACSKITDGTHFSPTNTLTGDFQYITAKNIKSHGIDLSKITYVTKKIHSEIYLRCNPEKGDVLYIKDGATTGLAAVNELDYPFSMLSSLALLKPNKEISDSYFLKYFLNNPATFKRLTGRMTGTAIKRIILEKIREAEIPLPSLKEQKEIVNEIDYYFSVTNNLKKSIMEETRRLILLQNSILKQAFEGKLISQDPNDEPASVLLERIKKKQNLIKN